jgi:enoyl-CoA hydratase
VAGNGPQVPCGSHRFDPSGAWRDPVPQPVVMAVNGIAFTLPIELAQAAGIVIAADDVRFRQLEIGCGIMLSGGATFRAPAQLGRGNAMRPGCSRAALICVGWSRGEPRDPPRAGAAVGVTSE